MLFSAAFSGIQEIAYKFAYRFFCLHSSIVASTRRKADTTPSGAFKDNVTEIPDHTNSWAPKLTCKVLAAVLVHSAYYAFWITTH
ncbi:unnamed protein product [Dicrocoelium dendriticum]|nr:unnamed protein product [Dicrocoelium dendriticum]